MPVAERISSATEEIQDRRALEETRSKHPIPPGVEPRCKRGRERMKEGAAERNETLQFWRGNQYVWRNPKGYLLQQDTITDWASGRGKPPHRIRTVRNRILGVVARKVSEATQRTPGFDTAPTTTDPEDITAAKLADRVAFYGYDKWSLRDVAVRTITLAILPGEGFAWPYFDNTIGPFIEHEGKKVGVGEIKVRVFTPNQVYWEPGEKFADSRWCAVELAMTPEEAKAIDGYVGGNLTTDADGDDHFSGPGKASNTRMVLVTHYLERPCPKYPDGRWITMANGRVIAGVEGDEARPYPRTNSKGEVVDEPVLHYLSYFTDPDNDRDFGLGKFLVDPQRTRNDIINKLLEAKNLAAIGQVYVTPGLMKKQRLTDAPGAVYEIPNPDQNIKDRVTPPPPQWLFQLLEQTDGDIADVAAQNDIPSQVESGKGIQALLESDRARDLMFFAAVAEWWSQLMRHCLSLVQRNYSEHDDRLMRLQGRFGVELIEGFKGADLRDQLDVRVLPGSIEPRTKQAIEQKILAFAERGWISPQAAMAAINGGTAEKLVEDYELDVAWANRTIQKVQAGPEVLFNQPPRVEVGPDGQPTEIPAWMPRPFQNLPVIKAVFESWFKTVDFERLEPGMQSAANEIYQGIEKLEAEKAMRDAQIQMQMAEGLGMANAARPQGAKPMPDSPSVTPGEGGLTTQNQPPTQSPTTPPGGSQ